MPGERPVGRSYDRPDLILPAALDPRAHRRADGGVDDRLQQLVLTAEVAIQGHSAYPSSVREALHREALEPVAVDQFERDPSDLIARQAGLTPATSAGLVSGGYRLSCS